MTRTSLITLALTVSLGACAHKGAETSDFAAGTPSYSTSTSAPSAGSVYGEAEAAAPAGDYDGGGRATTSSRAPAPMEDSAPAEYAARGDASVGAEPPPPRQKSRGLGTSYGETRYSHVHSTSFRRANSNPDVLLSMRYNDPQGIADLSSIRGGARRPQAATQSGSLRLSLVGEGGGVLPGAEIGGEVYAVGGVNQRYMIAVENHTNERYEVVASVDGLDVIDGGDASFAKRGYVVDPYTSFVIEGWRTSDDTVAAFRFSELGDSYAERKGKGRNVGVVGVAFFQEFDPVDYQELHRRDSADPFPNRYAPPPPPRRVY